MTENSSDLEFRITLAQANPVVGDLAGNAEKALAAWRAGAAAGAHIVAMPEMFVCGYQTQDLVMKPAFAKACMAEIERLAEATRDGPALAIGGPLLEDAGLFNAYFVLRKGETAVAFRKHHLPNDGVFDERRLFRSGPPTGPIAVNGVRLGCPVCEDMWYPDVAETLEETGAEILLVPNGSPYERNKQDRRIQHMVARTVETGLPVIYLNTVGGQDDQVFDGASFVLNAGGGLALQAAAFEEAVLHTVWRQGPSGWTCDQGVREVLPDAWEMDYHAMVLAVRDYARKCGFKTALLGLSGGVDSALTAVIAADALGPENVRCVMLPSRYTSQESLDDAAAVATALGCQLDTLSISGAVEAVGAGLAPFFAGTTPNEAEENVQSRLRGLYLMALSNKFGDLLLTTGNKSEVAVGYATLYGDMSGGYNPLKDLYKTRVFETCRWRNANHRPWMKGPAGEVIRPNVIDKPPTAELRENQTDQDSLPPYEVLDAILDMLIEQDASVADIVAAGHDPDTVKKVERLLALSEYKRFQSAPGVNLSPRAFWLERRYPLVNRWRDGG
jgi:NAD+ synthase